MFMYLLIASGSVLAALVCYFVIRVIAEMVLAAIETNRSRKRTRIPRKAPRLAHLNSTMGQSRVPWGWNTHKNTPTALRSYSETKGAHHAIIDKPKKPAGFSGGVAESQVRTFAADEEGSVQNVLSGYKLNSVTRNALLQAAERSVLQPNGGMGGSEPASHTRRAAPAKSRKKGADNKQPWGW